MTRAWTRSCAACSVRKGPIFLMLWSANLQDWAVFAMCSLKVSWSSKITPRFLTEADVVIVDEPSWSGREDMKLSLCQVEWMMHLYSALLCIYWAVGDVLSSMSRCLPGSLRSVQLPLDHLVEKRDRAVCHQHSTGRRSHVPVWWDPVM